MYDDIYRERIVEVKYVYVLNYFFFFQAEDGIRDVAVTGVQTCALPIYFRWATYLDIQYIPRVGELTVFCGALVGASLGFLWYNAHPAEVFMGDVGSLSLGGTLGTIAVIIKQEILLFFVGGIFVVEALSVILQVGSFKLRGKRIFRMAPIHHHFELLAWSESKVIVRFWIAALVFALFALTTLKLR